MGVVEQVRYWPWWAAGVCVLVGLLTLLSAGASGGGVSVADPQTALPQRSGTITGIVRTGSGTEAVEHRLVEIIDVASGKRHAVTTNKGGGFSVKVKPGIYRLQVALLSGERLAEAPGIVRVDPKAREVRAELVITTFRVSRPRAPVHQPATGLGAPIA